MELLRGRQLSKKAKQSKTPVPTTTHSDHGMCRIKLKFAASRHTKKKLAPWSDGIRRNIHDDTWFTATHPAGCGETAPRQVCQTPRSWKGRSQNKHLHGAHCIVVELDLAGTDWEWKYVAIRGGGVGKIPTTARPTRDSTNLGLNKLYSNISVHNSCMGSLWFQGPSILGMVKIGYFAVSWSGFSNLVPRFWL